MKLDILIDRQQLIDGFYLILITNNIEEPKRESRAVYRYLNKKKKCNPSNFINRELKRCLSADVYESTYGLRRWSGRMRGGRQSDLMTQHHLKRSLGGQNEADKALNRTNPHLLESGGPPPCTPVLMLTSCAHIRCTV